MAAKVILNPSADLGNGITYLETIEKAARPLGELDIVLSEFPGHAVELAQTAVAGGCDLLVAAGGDGTVHEVVNGLMLAGGGARLGILPMGTGNDFAFAANVAEDMPTAIANLFRGQSRPVDLALVEDDKGQRRYVANNMGVGLDANVVIRTEAITRVHGFLKYFSGVLTALLRDFNALPVQARFDEEEIAEDVLFLYLGIGTRGGGGFLLTPDASQGDGLIDSCTVPMLGRLRVLTLLNSAIKGTHVNTPYVTMRQNRQIVIHSQEAMPVQIDGEIYATPADGIRRLLVTSLPAAVELVV